MTYNPIDLAVGGYGSEEIFYNAMVPDTSHKLASTATIINGTNQQEVVRLKPYKGTASSKLHYAVGSLDMFGTGKSIILDCQGLKSMVDVFSRFPFPMAQHWHIGASQSGNSVILSCSNNAIPIVYDHCVPCVVSDDELNLYGFDFKSSYFVVWQRRSLNQTFSAHPVAYPYQGMPFILGISDDKSKWLYCTARRINHQPPIFLLSLQNQTDSELSHIPNICDIDSSNRSLVITEQDGFVDKLPFSGLEASHKETPFLASTFSDFENNDCQIMPVQ